MIMPYLDYVENFLRSSAAISRWLMGMVIRLL